jgi:hypothetical protein
MLNCTKKRNRYADAVPSTVLHSVMQTRSIVIVRLHMQMLLLGAPGYTRLTLMTPNEQVCEVS